MQLFPPHYMSSQPDLFGLPAAEGKPADAAPHGEKPAASQANSQAKSRAKGVGAAAANAERSAIADRLTPAIYLGTSSWSFPGWEGLVYDSGYPETRLAREGLQAYAQHALFRTVGIDRTFYSPISEADYAKYAAQVPDHFRFLVKAPMAITSSYVRDDSGKFSDSPYYLDADYATREFVNPALAGLGGKSGPLVFQFPPQGNITRNPDAFINRLYRFLKALPPYPLYAVEIRDPELMTTRFFTCLKTVGAQFCLASHARMPGPREQTAAMRAVMPEGAFIARWSLHSGFKYEDAKARYQPFNRLVDEDPDSRAVLAAECVRAAREGQPCYVIVNNKAEGSSPLSIEKLAAAIVEDLHSPTSTQATGPELAAQTD